MILFVHLYNDLSGSPRVLKNVIDSVSSSGQDCKLYVGSDGTGLLDDVSITVQKYPYKRFNTKILTLLSYVASQFILFFKLVLSKECRQADCVYVNTVLPFGAAIFAKFMGIKLVYHVHEISIKPAPLAWFLKMVVRLTASQVIYVSNAHMEMFVIEHPNKVVLHNAFDPSFEQVLSQNSKRISDDSFRVLMLASYRDYKGIHEFVRLCDAVTHEGKIKFDLVLNDDLETVNVAAQKLSRPTLSVHLPDANTHRFYENADMVVNLSRVDGWIETFGLTLIEAMAYGLPVIAPPVGGPTEIVEHGSNGFLIDSRDHSALVDCVLKIANQPALQAQLSESAKARAHSFSPNVFQVRLNQILTSTMKQESHDTMNRNAQ